MTTRLHPGLLVAALATVPVFAARQEPQKPEVQAGASKESVHEQMRGLAAQLLELRAAGAPARRIDALQAQYDALSRSLGGDDPARILPAGGSVQAAALAPTVAPHSQLAPAACAGMSVTTTNVPGTGGPITPPTTFQGVTFQTTVSGAGTYLWDIDLNTSITHTFASDLDITLESPAGTIVKITTDNGGGFDDVFNGTLWDDNANDPATDHVYTNLVLASPLSPEGRLAAFRGEDPNGIWKLKIYDDAGADVGNLSAWSLDISTLPSAPVESTTTLSSTPALPILDLATVADTLNFAGLPTYLDKVVLYLEVTHTENQDLDITLTSPNGTVVAVTTDNAGANDNVFNGTTFDPDTTDTVTDHVYTNLVVATLLSPEGSFDNFLGQDPNGIWTLSIADDLATDTGTLVRWDLSVTTTAPPSPSGPFNTPGPGGPIPDFTSGGTPVATVFNVPVSGLATYLWDVDLTTAISHTACADVDMTLTSPSGTIVTITSDNAGTLDNCFNGTLWDDNANDPVTDHVFTNLTVASPLSPEGRLDAFRGEDPNGTWTLTLYDDAAADSGTLNSWALDLSTLASAPPAASVTYSNSPNITIPSTAPPNIFTDTIAVSGQGTTTLEIEAYIEIIHTFAGDLDISLTSPAGTVVTLTTDNGGGFDNVFDGTLFDGSATDTVTDHVYTNLVIVPLLAPEGSLAKFIGEDPNGTWTMTVSDDANADGGTWVRWDLTVRTCPGSSITAFCDPGAAGVIACPCSNPPVGAGRGCDNSSATGGASIAGSGVASLAADTVSFVSSDEKPTATSIVLQGTTATLGSVFGQGVRCTAGILKRLYVKTASGGSITAPGPGDLSVSARSAALGDPISASQHRYYTIYYRDPVVLGGCPATSTFNATNALDILWAP